MTAPGQDSARPLPQFDSERNIILLGESRLVFHCHHYNLFLQRTIEDALEADGPRIQTAARCATSPWGSGWERWRQPPAWPPSASTARRAPALPRAHPPASSKSRCCDGDR